MSVESTFNELQGLGIQRTDFHENMSWDEYVEELKKATEKDDKLRKLLRTRVDKEARVEQVTLDDIMSANFMKAKELIDEMTLAKRIAVLHEVHEYRDYLYESVGKYGAEGIAKDERLAAKDFRALMGRIKHLEILQNWLYGIV